MRAPLHFVTGKGGTGRTTVALALGLAFARRGQRTLVVELGETGGLARALAAPPETGLSLASLAAEPALARFLEAYLPSRRLAARAGRSPVLGALLRAAPGTIEIAQLDALVRAQDDFDRVVVDGEASGQTLSLLDTPKVFVELGAAGIVGERLAQLTRSAQHWTFHATVLARRFVWTETETLLRGLAARGARRGGLVCTGPEIGATSAGARAADWGPAREDLEHLAARAEEADDAQRWLDAHGPWIDGACSPAPRTAEALAALGERLLPQLEAPT